MHNNVISSIFSELQANNISCLRFNFRGVGKSTGVHPGINGELADVRTCIDYLTDENFDKILICGYSYGAAIGCSLVNYSERVIGYCAISFPWDFMGKKFKESTQTIKSKLFIQGTKDNIASFDKFDSHYDFYMEPKLKFIIEGADHFYWGFESIISQRVLKFTRNQFGIIA